MRLLSVRLLAAIVVVLLLAAGQVSVNADPGSSSHTSPSTRHLSKRQEREVAAAWSKVQVPERLKDWEIFQDGGRFRETIRKGYVGVLRQVDKLHDPYSEFRHIKKQWVYEPDLRKHYMLPRVLRIPVISQETAIPHLKPFVAAVKDADSELKLNTAAREHAPDLSEHLEDEKEAEAAASESEAQLSKKNDAATDSDSKTSPQRGSRGRRRRFNRKNSFQQFRPQHDSLDQPSVSLPRSEIESDGSTARPSADEVQRVDSNEREEATPGEGPKQDTPALRRFRDGVMKFQDRFERIKNFQGEQISRAAQHYRAPAAQVPPDRSVVSPGEMGLRPVRLSTIESGDASLEPTPRVDDPKGMEADVSNPITPSSRQRNTAGFWSNTALGRTGSVESDFYGKTPVDPSPARSPQQGSTPRYQGGTGRSTPGGPRLPPDYADLVHAARVRQGLSGQPRQPADVLKPSVWKGSPGPVSDGDTRSGSDWNPDRPSEEAIRKMQEAAKFHNADYVVYDRGVTPGTHTPKTPATGPEAQPAQQLPASPKNTATSQRDSQDPAATASDPGREPLKGAGRPAALLDIPPRLTAAQLGLHDAKPSESGLSNVEPSSPEAARAAKRKRPNDSSQPSSSASPAFKGFGAPGAELPSPQLKGFKPSLVNQETFGSDVHDPMAPAMAAFRRSGTMDLVRSGPTYRSKLRGSTLDTPDESIRVLRERPSGRAAGDSPDFFRKPRFPEPGPAQLD